MTGRNSDRRLYEDLVRSHAADVYRFACRFCGDRELADDLVQETFCEAWRSISSLNDPTRGRAWLLQILRHRYSHAVRRQTRRIRTNPDMVRLNQTSSAPGADILDRLSDQEMLQEALDGLDDRYKEPFLLVFLEDFTCRETAELLNVPLGTVLSRIHRARQQLRAAIRRLDVTFDNEKFQPASNQTS